MPAPGTIESKLPAPPSVGKNICSRDPEARAKYPGLLKKAASFLEAQYGLTISGNHDFLPSAPDGATIARHFAAYLALSGVTSWHYSIQDQITGEPVPLLITKPQKSDTVNGFRAIAFKPWMKDVPELNKLFLKSLRNPASYFRQNNYSATPWFKQVESGVQTFRGVLELAGELAAHEDIYLKSPEPQILEPDTSDFDLFAAYRNASAETAASGLSS